MSDSGLFETLGGSVNVPVKIVSRTSHTATTDHGDFPLAFEPVDDSVIVELQGDCAIVGYLVHDEECGEFYFDEFDEGEYYNIGDNRSMKYKPMEVDEIKQLARKNPGRVFWISKYDHSLVRYYRSGDAISVPNRHARDRRIAGPSASPADRRLIIPDQQWDVSRGVALYVAPDDCPDPAAYCDGQMEAFSDWCNGVIFGVVVQGFDREVEDGEPIWSPDAEEDACWGFIGHEHAEASLKESMKEAPNA